jgi:methionyl-tRNA formyltransferase
MKLAFAGTPEFARIALQALCEAGHELVLVLTQPDRPAGRGMKLQASPVKIEAQKRGLRLAQPRSLRLDGKYAHDAAEAQQALQQAAPEALIVAAYGLILPVWTLQMPRWGALNIHASLLPRWRGAAPIHRAIEAGDAETGVTIMQMDEGLDTGGMLRSESTPIGPHETTGQLHERLATLGARLMVEVLHDPPPWRAQPQPESGVCYAHKIDKAESWLDWRLSAHDLARRLRAFDPFPGGATRWGSETIKVWAAQSWGQDRHPEPGMVLAIAPLGIDVATGAGVLRLTELQKPGGKRMACADFLRGHGLRVGDRFEVKSE